MAERFNLEVHSFEWCDDFAAARNFALSKMTTDWVTWLDSDDVLEDAENFRQWIAEAEYDVGGIFCPYVYSTDEYGTPTTLLDKERLIRRSVGWQWVDRLHETLSPQSYCRYDWKQTPVWVHNDTDVEDHGERNMRLLQKWLEEEPERIRIWMHIGSQFNADGDYAQAANWYIKFAKYVGPNGEQGSEHDRWYALTYAARCLRELKRWDEASQADLAAMYIFPNWADPYIGMAETMYLKGEYEKAVTWGELAMRLDETDRIMFSNLLDYIWRLQGILNVCYAKLGDWQKAKYSAEYALVQRPADAQLRHNLRTYTHILEAQKEAYRHRRGLNNNPIRTMKRFTNPFTNQLDEVRDITMPALLQKAVSGTQPKVAFFCGRTLQEWNGDSPYKEGIGGSETAVVEVTKRLAKKGFKPVVYGSVGRVEGMYDGVLYLNWPRWRPWEKFDHFVSWRNPRIVYDKPQNPHVHFWAHDLNYDRQLTPDLTSQYETVIPVSEWHGEYLKRLYPFIENVKPISNGINLDRFTKAKEKVGLKQPWKIVWASSLDRGLRNLLDIWPIIHQIEPAAELHIFYGTELLEKQMAAGSAVSRWVLESIRPGLEQPGVFLRGKVDQDTLAEEFTSAEMWLYPTSFLETFCITAVEAMAADLFCVTSDSGNLPSLLGEAGICVPGHANTWSFQDKFLDCTVEMMQNVGRRASYRGVGPKRAKQFTWDKAAKQWATLLAN